MIVIIEKTSPEAKLPTKAHEGDYCYDVYATSEEEIAPNVWKYGLGFRYEVKHTAIAHLNCALHFYPRSSIYKTGMVLSNSVGTLDEGYRGEVSAIFYHVVPFLPRYKVGDRIGQICFTSTASLEFREGEVDGATERGAHGFGSTGR